MTDDSNSSNKCANLTAGSFECQNIGSFTCSGCRLVAYCGRSCQKSHWNCHKIDCRSPLNDPRWRPAWDQQSRPPAWTLNDQRHNPHNPFGSQRYLWGNMPAFDVLQLDTNEGLEYSDDIALLFAASGDLRNVVKTIADLPSGFNQNLHLTINDRDLHVVARNLVLLLLVFGSDDGGLSGVDQKQQLSESFTHVWYSTFIDQSAYTRIQKVVLPLISKVCERALLAEPGCPLQQTWHFSPRKTLHVSLKREEWLFAERMCSVPGDLTHGVAHQLRTALTLAPERTDYRDRWLFKELPPALRVGQQKFRESGLLLPFGHSHVDYNIPNPTLFQDAPTWSMDDKVDPLTGWPIWDVRNEKSSPSSDMYGKLFFHLRIVFQRFLDRLDCLSVYFEMYCEDVTRLANQLPKNHFARIEVSNISDAGYLGIQGTLSLLSPLLQPRHTNPHATLITLFINAVIEVVNSSEERNSLGDMDILMQHLPQPDILALFKPDNADTTRMWDARTLTLDMERYFEIYKAIQRFDEIESAHNVYMKPSNTITEEWPTRLKCKTNEAGAFDEFSALLGSNLIGVERYVEWVRA